MLSNAASLIDGLLGRCNGSTPRISHTPLMRVQNPISWLSS